MDNGSGWMNWTVISAVSGVIAAVIAIFSYVGSVVRGGKSDSKKVFSTRYSTNKLVRKASANYSKISVLYDGKSIEDVSITKYAIWNSGNLVISKDDIPPGGEIRVIVNDTNSILLDVNITSVTNDVNAFSVKSINEKEAIICFEYANPNDGALIEVLHTGKSSVTSIKCDIIGSKGIDNRGVISSLAFAPKHSKLLGINAVLLMLVTVAEDIIYVLETFFGYDIPNTITGSEAEKYIGLAFILMFTVMCFVLSITILRKNYFTGIPSALKERM